MSKIKVKAGILLYALFMAAVFSLLLQFYLNRQVANQRLFQANREQTEAYALAVLTKGVPIIAGREICWRSAANSPIRRAILSILRAKRSQRRRIKKLKTPKILKKVKRPLLQLTREATNINVKDL